MLNTYLCIMSNLIQELGRDNLCTYFVLPLLKLNKVSFISSNFINSYITYDCKKIVVKVYDTTLVSRKVFLHPGYHLTKLVNGEYLFVFIIPEKWLNDVRLYRQGLYSRISEDAKSTIRQWSNLKYKDVKGNKHQTDARLLALVRHPKLKEALESELGYEYGPDEELLFPPRENSFISF